MGRSLCVLPHLCFGSYHSSPLGFSHIIAVFIEENGISYLSIYDIFCMVLYWEPTHTKPFPVPYGRDTQVQH